MDRKDIKSMTYEELEADIIEMGLPKFRAGQLYRQLFQKLKTSFFDMSDISASLAQTLSERYVITAPEIISKLVSKIDGTEKYLLCMSDGNMIETVLMRYEHGNTVCVSTQVGCRMGCAFCASTKNGFVRSLEPSEILSQIETVTREHMSEEGFRVSNIVLMGIGEPLDNYDNVIKFLNLVNDKRGLEIGYRHISLSTCGVVPGIMKLAKEELPITLSISLHAPNDKIRSENMPINRKYNIEELLSACREYQKICGRRISFEYALIDGVNDSVEHAKELAKRLKGIMCHVNLIPVNTIKEKNFKKSTKNSINLFTKTLNDSKINATVRRKLGSDIDAACGQLRNDHIKTNE
ncbi:MAG: 23S rRNA (adenine(2503)-C(2))-methyltransferase RlmN [Ruminococcaceae bacterium]|nr:23S rRNA (adenine(2503)-C(2))-methyltransferase RlmN [Oscillospiraceae bacterium]